MNSTIATLVVFPFRASNLTLFFTAEHSDVLIVSDASP